MCEAVVEGGLALEEVLFIILGSWCIGFHIAAACVRCGVGSLAAFFYFFLVVFRDVVGPDVVVAVT